MKILLCATGSVAAIKTPVLGAALQSDHTVKIAMTKSAKFFLDKYYNDSDILYQDKDEWNDSYKLGEPVLHIDLRAWADLLVIAPCSANSLAKISYGLADNLTTCVARAWDFEKPCILAPAMNTMMWDNPVTREHLDRVQGRGFTIVDPIAKKLACGDIGIGAMAEVETIVNCIQELA
ncbi:UNVERIFIED_CONTAM: hypothetical protein GTU68_031821 [Idotea baltica]|nr:hypothetical protein [Idotea baltica]